MEISTYELSVFAVLSFFAGTFASIYISRLFDVIHAWRIVNEAILSILWLLTKITEDMAFLQELKLKQMRESGFCLLYTSPSPRDRQKSRMPSSA